MTGPNTRSRAQHDEGSLSRGPYSAVVGEPSQQHDRRGSTPEEALPPPPTMVEVLAQIERNRIDQTRILEAIARNTSPAPAATGGGGNHRAHGGLADFQRTNPPTFAGTEDPMEAEDWLRNIEKKLAIAQCTGIERVLFASYQLEGAASAWWDNFSAMQLDGDIPSWNEFRAAFREAHIPKGVMSIKQQQFLALKQGKKTVTEYFHEFNSLARYAPDDVSIDARR